MLYLHCQFCFEEMLFFLQRLFFLFFSFNLAYILYFLFQFSLITTHEASTLVMK